MLLQRHAVAAGGEEEAVVELGAAALKGALADHVHGAGNAAGRIGGRGNLGHLDAGDIVDRDLHEIKLARGGVAGGVGEGGAVAGDVGLVGIEAADGDREGHHVGILDRDAGQVFHELGDIALDHVAKGIGRDDVLDVCGEALLVGRERLALGEL